MIRMVSGGYSKNGTIRGQLLRYDFIMVGQSWPQWSSNACSRSRASVERLFRRLKGYRRIFSRFEKLHAMFLGFLSFVLVVDGLRGLG